MHLQSLTGGTKVNKYMIGEYLNVRVMNTNNVEIEMAITFQIQHDVVPSIHLRIKFRVLLVLE